MAESNLRTLLASARATGMHPDQRLPDSEMEAILGVLKGNGDQPAGDHPAQDDADTLATPDPEEAVEGS